MCVCMFNKQNKTQTNMYHGEVPTILLLTRADFSRSKLDNKVYSLPDSSLPSVFPLKVTLHHFQIRESIDSSFLASPNRTGWLHAMLSLSLSDVLKLRASMSHLYAKSTVGTNTVHACERMYHSPFLWEKALDPNPVALKLS